MCVIEMQQATILLQVFLCYCCKLATAAAGVELTSEWSVSILTWFVLKQAAWMIQRWQGHRVIWFEETVSVHVIGCTVWLCWCNSAAAESDSDDVKWLLMTVMNCRLTVLTSSDIACNQSRWRAAEEDGDSQRRLRLNSTTAADTCRVGQVHS